MARDSIRGKAPSFNGRIVEKSVQNASYKPEPHTVCVECRQPIGNEEYYWTKSRGYPPTFIHKRCYEKLLPRNRGKADGTPT